MRYKTIIQQYKQHLSPVLLAAAARIPTVFREAKFARINHHTLKYTYILVFAKGIEYQRTISTSYDNGFHQRNRHACACVCSRWRFPVPVSEPKMLMMLQIMHWTEEVGKIDKCNLLNFPRLRSIRARHNFFLHLLFGVRAKFLTTDKVKLVRR